MTRIFLGSSRRAVFITGVFVTLQEICTCKGGARVHGLGGVLYVFGGWVSGAMGGHEHDLPAGLWVCCMPPSRLPRVLCHGRLRAHRVCLLLSCPVLGHTLVERVRGLWPRVREMCVLRRRRGLFSYEYELRGFTAHSENLV